MYTGINMQEFLFMGGGGGGGGPPVIEQCNIPHRLKKPLVKILQCLRLNSH